VADWRQSCRPYSKKIIKAKIATKPIVDKAINIEQIHKPVLLNEVIEKLAIKDDGGLIIDATLGLGGYTRQILCKSVGLLQIHSPLAAQNSSTRVLGIDRDTEALALARTRLAPLADRFVAQHARFGDLFQVVQRDMYG
jgi:16S rRNA (cytosine1402-N4)-methyltransferase